MNMYGIVVPLVVYALVGLVMFFVMRRYNLGWFEVLFWPLLLAIAVATVAIMLAAKVLVAFLSVFCEVAFLFSGRRQ